MTLKQCLHTGGDPEIGSPVDQRLVSRRSQMDAERTAQRNALLILQRRRFQRGQRLISAYSVFEARQRLHYRRRVCGAAVMRVAISLYEALKAGQFTGQPIVYRSGYPDLTHPRSNAFRFQFVAQ